MQPRTLDQIQAELASTYDPQVNAIRSRQALIPGQMAEEEKGLEAKQQLAFGNILNGARRRGLGFSGIPLGEQATYTASEYLPAIARLRQTGKEQQMSLEDAILGINERRNTTAQSLYQAELDRAEQRRQFEAQLAAQREAAARASASSFSPSYDGGQQTPVITPETPVITPEQQNVFNSVRGMLDSGDQQRILREFNAIATSASYGNNTDKAKLQLLYRLQPSLFNGRSGALKLAGVA